MKRCSTEKDRSQSQQSNASNGSSDKTEGTQDKSPTKRTSLTESVRIRRSIDYSGQGVIGDNAWSDKPCLHIHVYIYHYI